MGDAINYRELHQQVYGVVIWAKRALDRRGRRVSRNNIEQNWAALDLQPRRANEASSDLIRKYYEAGGKNPESISRLITKETGDFYAVGGEAIRIHLRQLGLEPLKQERYRGPNPRHLPQRRAGKKPVGGDRYKYGVSPEAI